MIAIIDYRAGNLNSVGKALHALGAEVSITNQPETVLAAEKIILPGVGHFSALSALTENGLADALFETLRSGKPFLGICLGMQWLFEGSEEAPNIAAARFFSGVCKKFPSTVKCPHVGWNSLATAPHSRLLQAIAPQSFVYYTHSFHAPIVDTTTAQTEYGLPFSAVVERGNIFGVQFHPEKSGQVGLSILKAFCEAPSC